MLRRKNAKEISQIAIVRPVRRLKVRCNQAGPYKLWSLKSDRIPNSAMAPINNNLNTDNPTPFNFFNFNIGPIYIILIIVCCIKWLAIAWHITQVTTYTTVAQSALTSTLYATLLSNKPNAYITRCVWLHTTMRWRNVPLNCMIIWSRVCPHEMQVCDQVVAYSIDHRI